ncbi:MAG: YfbR-like 5'-deoxynucleotidase [Candidatus Hodarchaeales archaeon]|jgi:5'-deoxynucleotidase YfbR-like HD superfamily hydrolase
MQIFENIVSMKRLLRQGWVRAGVPISSIESLADHSWSVAALTFIFSTLENELRENPKFHLNVEKAVIFGLFHDLTESEYFDFDKSINRLVSQDTLKNFQHEIETGAIKSIISKIPLSISNSLESILKEQHCEEYQVVKVADLIDLIFQAKEYYKKHWIDEGQFQEFTSQALTHLKHYKDRFSFLKEYINSSF